MSRLIKKLKLQLEAIGGSLDYLENAGTLVCDAPSAYVWKANNHTSYSIAYLNRSGQTWLAQAMRIEMPALKLGLRKITDPKEIAQYRHDLDDESWDSDSNTPEQLTFP